jgi:hypothetical protein
MRINLFALLQLKKKVLVALCHSFCKFIFLLDYIHSSNHSLITFAEALFHIFTAAGSVGGTFLGCRADIRTRACHTASQRTMLFNSNTVTCLLSISLPPVSHSIIRVQCQPYFYRRHPIVIIVCSGGRVKGSINHMPCFWCPGNQLIPYPALIEILNTSPPLPPPLLAATLQGAWPPGLAQPSS